MVATVNGMAADTYYLSAQKTWRRESEGGDGRPMELPGLSSSGDESGGAIPGLAATTDGGTGGAQYYQGGEEPDGVWWNPNGMFDLEDGGAVGAREFRRLYAGFDPDSGDRLTRNAGDERRSPGLDMTFSADKTVSALWAIADEETRAGIEAAHNEAARKALDMIVAEHCSWTRTRSGGGDIVFEKADICGAMFQHGTSRDGDPQLHTHCLVFNVTQAADGVFRSHYRPPVFRWKKAAGAVYRNALARELQDRLGVTIERYGRDEAFTRIAGVPDELVAEWSKRRRTIADMAESLGFETGANAAAAAGINKATRKAKLDEQGGDLRHAAWDLEASAHIEDLAAFVEDLLDQDMLIDGEDLAAAIDRVVKIPDDITQHEAVFRLPDVIERAMNATAGVFSPGVTMATVEQVLDNDEVVELDMPPPSLEVEAGMAHTRVFSTASLIRKERELGAMAAAVAGDGSLAIDAAAIETKIGTLRRDGYPISDEQAAAIRYGAGAGSGKLAIIEGAAGAGKTTTLRPITDLLQEQGCTVIATAVAWRTAVALGTDCGVAPFSVDRLLRRAAKGEVHLDDRTVIVVDEAGMLSVPQAWQLLRLAREHGCKVIAAGDTHQHQPIGAGPGLRLMREASHGVRVDEIRRQKADAEDVLVQAHGQDPQDARYAVGMMSAEQKQRVLDEYEAMPIKPEVKAWQILVSEAFRDGRAADAIALLAERDRFVLGRDLITTLDELVNDWERWRLENPEGVATVIARTHDEVQVLSHLMRERVLARVAGSDKRVVVRACGARARDREKDLEIARGDLLRIGALVWEKRLFNGTVVEVQDIAVHGQGTEGERVEIRARSEYGDDVSFFVDELVDYHGKVRLDHGYAMTIASSQGRTVDAAFVLADDRAPRPTIYPAVTRHREHMRLYVNRAPLAEAVREKRSEDLVGSPVTDHEIAAHLASRWSREGAKEAATDYLAAGRRHHAGGKGAAAWAAANDNEGGGLRRVARAIRHASDRWRYGARVSAVAGEIRELEGEYRDLVERHAAAAGGAAVPVEEFAEIARSQGAVVRRMAAFAGTGHRWRALWREAGDMDVAEVEAFRHRHEDLSAWVDGTRRRMAAAARRDVESASRDSGSEPRDGESASRKSERGEASMESRADVARALLVESCVAQGQDRYRWIAEGQDMLDDLHARAIEALGHWPAGDDEGRAVVAAYVDDYAAAMRAWTAGREVVEAVGRLGSNGDAAGEALAAIDTIEAGRGRVWHEETLRIVGSSLLRQQLLDSPAPWLEGAREKVQAALAAGAATTERLTDDDHADNSAHAGDDAPTYVEIVERDGDTRAGDVVPRPAPRPAAVRPERRRELPGVREVRNRLAERAEEVCRTYLPGGRRQGGYWKVGGVHGEAGESMFVLLGGPNAGHWEDKATGERGDLVDLIRAVRGLPDIAAALPEASAFLGVDNVAAMPTQLRGGGDSASRSDDRQRRAQAVKNWGRCRPLRSGERSAAAVYLLKRGIDPYKAPGLRWSPNLSTRDGGKFVKWPAVVAKIETWQGEFRGIQRVFLTRRGDKAPLSGGAKKHQGSLDDGGVWFGNRQARRIVMTEGVEDALAAITALPADALENLAVVASVGADRMAQVALPPTATEVVVLQDPGETAARNFRSLQARCKQAGIAVRAILQDVDVNDALQTDRAALARLLAPLADTGAALASERVEGGDGLGIDDLMGRVRVWRAAAASGGWAAADIRAMGADVEDGRAMLAQGGTVLDAGVREALADFVRDGAAAADAMRLASGVVAGMDDLWRQRAEILANVAGADNPAVAALVAAGSADMDRWTERAGRALDVMSALQASQRTAWDAAVLALLAEKVPQDAMTTPTANARYYLISSVQRLKKAVKSDDALRRSATGEVLAESMGMKRGGPGYRLGPT
ncbi:MAG: relaxase domain-containing protein [bacterium]|nr:relaxase domain-containing protein [bacterium]